MKRVYSAPSPLLVGHMRNILQNAGVRCFIRNEGLIGGAGELPPTLVWPELWVEREIDHARAERLVEEAMAEPEPGGGWTCPSCQEHLEDQFDTCWNCGRERPARTS